VYPEIGEQRIEVGMKLISLEGLGPRQKSSTQVSFGVLFPWINPSDGHRFFIKVIHEKDQFLHHIPPMEFELTHSTDPQYGDRWNAEIQIDPADTPHTESAWGQKGRYLYRYCLKNSRLHLEIDWIIDPFAREFGTGKLSAFTLGYEHYSWSPEEMRWKTPRLRDLIIYELMINEFGGSIDGVISKLGYLADLGINCIELMPVFNVSNTVDWGFLPLGYLGVDERFGKRKDLQKLINAAHLQGIAVILDVVYGHTDEHFPYYYLYDRLGYAESPFMGSFAKDYFGKSTDFSRSFTRDFFFTVNHHWLDCYHVDGFRYDCVPNYWDGPLGQGFANLAYNTYKSTQAKRGTVTYWHRFFGDGTEINLIQCAEQLEAPQKILDQSYANCTWQNFTLDSARAVAKGDTNAITTLGYLSGLMGFPKEKLVNEDLIEKTALQYIENHDHSRFLCNFKTMFRGNELLGEGDRGLWFRLQPYLIFLFTARGIPMIWQGQEFGENYYLPEQGLGRVLMFRPVRWDYFFDTIGQKVLGLVRRLIRLRRKRIELRQGDHYFYNDFSAYQSKGLLLFSRSFANDFTLVALNFGMKDQEICFPFPHSGSYTEELHGIDNLSSITAGEPVNLIIPSNYGRIWALNA